MINFSRRQLAKYAVDEMISKQPVASLSAHLAAVLILSRRQKEVELLLSDIDQELEERGLIVRADVTSAHPLSEQLKNELKSQIKKTVGADKVILQEQVDKRVIGGIRIETSTRSWDRTLKSTVSNIKDIV